jgi:hypothetical protein
VFEKVPSSDPTVTGVSVRLAGDYRTATRTNLIDATPATATFADAPFQPGQGFVDPTSGIGIAVESVTPGAASVRVTVPGTIPLNAEPAAAALSVAPQPALVTATASLRRVSARRGVLRVVVPLTDGAHECSVRISAEHPRARAIGATCAMLVRTVVLGRRAVPVQVRVDGNTVMSVRLQVPGTGKTTRLTKAFSL